MTVSVICLYTRRADISPTEFKRYMEDVHVPIQKEVMGKHYPLSFPRRYVARIESGAGDRLGAPSASKKHGNPESPVVLVGTPEELGWDLMAEMIFRDELHMQQCYATINTLDGQRMKDDEENFTETSQLKVVLVGESTSS
ncbi:EthD domain-containing protein [Phaeosphaeria sp. MPI-PUGE-AT-0046c]|nr:EthD domain-containing protein [Phaeosphaeria sp. MPI-PUGE-AT-0046c]